jgi:hypothetical protein
MNRTVAGVGGVPETDLGDFNFPAACPSEPNRPARIESLAENCNYIYSFIQEKFIIHRYKSPKVNLENVVTEVFARLTCPFL